MNKIEMKTQRWINACDAYWWVYNHPKMLWKECSPPNIDITPHMVCPETNQIEDDPTLNTKMQFWVECGAYVDTELGVFLLMIMIWIVVGGLGVKQY